MSASQRDSAIVKLCKTFPEAFGVDEKDARQRQCRYFIHRVLGAGATGTVFGASRTSDGTRIAVKCVDMEGMSAADRARAQSEVDCLLNCDYFSILKCHEDLAVYEERKPGRVQVIALVLDYANAGDLRHEIRRRARGSDLFAEHEAGMLFIQILLAIHHVHSKHMIHRDIKSANVFLCHNGLVKLGDFGFSKHYANTVSNDVARTFCGTPCYVAPEIWRHRPYSKKADMFSLGVLLYELLTLERPFDGEDIEGVMESTLNGLYKPLRDGVSAEMATMCHSLLEVNPERRPTTVQLLRTPICRLFMAGLLEIMQANPFFREEEGRMVIAQLQQTHESLTHPPSSLFSNASRRWVPAVDSPSSKSSYNDSLMTSATPGSPEMAEVVNGTVLIEGVLRKQSRNMSWKKRYVCVCAAPPSGSRGVAAAGTVSDGYATLHNGSIDGDSSVRSLQSLKLVLALTQESIAENCVVTPFSSIADVLPVPAKYSGAKTGYVFAIVMNNGKRQLFLTHSKEKCGEWIDQIQELLGFIF